VSLIPRSRAGALIRFALAALIVVGFAATTTAVAGLLQFKQIAHYISATPALKLKTTAVTIPNPGNPQTLLLIGSDHRAGTSWNSANTDTMMLVRLDPNSSTINLLSVPRDLEVQIPEGGAAATGKLNAAYSVGGPGLLVQILQQQVFPGIQINHVIDINFGGFIDLINAVGCVYTDVDHRYYNNTATTDYSSIDLQPGYQKLCGTDALEFVRFRHTDTDIVRNARQQDFLRWAKDQFSPTQIVENRDTLLKIFGQHAQTDANLHTTDGLINLFNLVAFSAGHTIKQIPFPAILLPCPPPPPNASSAEQQTPCYLTATQSGEQSAYQAFMTPTTNQPPPVATSPSAGAAAAGGRATSAPAPANVTGLTADVADGQAQAKALGIVGLPVYYPRLIQAGSQYCTPSNGQCPMGDGNPAAADGVPSGYPRAYLIHDQAGNAHPAYRMTLVINSLGGEYYGVQGTTWQNPPILDNPTETKVVIGKQLLLYANGGKISLVAWRTAEGVYWISNTLTDDISNQQMVAIAASLTPAAP
jgi:polyisoprenyl-teichoic acid--peptidoglycan teichoic acid transferase